jgi:hypothetical protein
MYLALFIASFTAAFGFGMITSSSAVMTAPAVAVEAEVMAMQPTDTLALPELLDCAPQSPTGDIASSMQVIDPRVFEPSIWTVEGGLQSDRETTLWRSERYGALAYLEYLHYDCGVSAAALDTFFSPEGFDVMLSTYDSHEQTAACRRNGLRLYEFDATLNGTDYHYLHWAHQASPTRVVSFSIVFPKGWEEKLVGYAARLYPELPGCDALK